MAARFVKCGSTVGKDYRIGLAVGAVLVVVALFWVATRPSLSPRLPSVQLPQINNQDPLRTDAGATPPITGSAPEANRPAHDEIGQAVSTGRKTENGGQPSVIGLPSSVQPDLTVFEKDQPIKTTKFHIVRQGETLSAIAQQYYGSPNNWRKILTANGKAIKDANKIAPGTKLIIPE